MPRSSSDRPHEAQQHADHTVTPAGENDSNCDQQQPIEIGYIRESPGLGGRDRQSPTKPQQKLLRVVP
jgi:hypothetical protein